MDLLTEIRRRAGIEDLDEGGSLGGRTNVPQDLRSTLLTMQTTVASALKVSQAYSSRPETFSHLPAESRAQVAAVALKAKQLARQLYELLNGSLPDAMRGEYK